MMFRFMQRFARRVSCRWRAGALLGETPVWDDRLGCLAFIDVPRGDILRYWPVDGRHGRTHVATELGFLARGSDSQHYCGTGLEVSRISGTGGFDEPVATLPGDPAILRLNDGRVDSRGDIWTGSMDRSGTEPLGALFRIRSDGACEQFDDGYTIPNGFAFSRGERDLYVADSPKGIVYAYEVGSDGRPGNRREWLRIAMHDGFPDGMTIDFEDHVWLALYGGGCVRRYRPDATLEREIRIPTSDVTSCTFGGADLDVLFITTAAMTPRRTWREMLGNSFGGALFSCDLSASGISGAPPEAV